MRCPKCSFVSFDLVETCVKCGKNISGAATELQGTVVGVEAPSFLRVAGAGESPGAAEQDTGYDGDEPLDLGAEGEEEAVDFSFDDEPSVEAGSEEVELDLAEVGDAGEAAVEIDLGEEDALDVDLGGDEEEMIGISDLSPAEEIDEVQIGEEDEFEVAVEEVAEGAESGTGLGLGDLQVDGIDLESTPGADDPGKIVPSVKTGTALDDFDIDLGDLMTGGKG